MAKADPKVMEFVEGQLKKTPGVSSGDLHQITKKKFRSVGKLSVRQFHATYPLQVRRKAAPKRSRPKRGRSAGGSVRKSGSTRSDGGSNRDAVRTTLLEFASDIAAANERADLVKVLAGVDGYVDRIMGSVK